MKQDKRHTVAIVFYLTILFSVETVHLLYILNPGLPVTTSIFAFTLLKVLLVSALIALIPGFLIHAFPRLTIPFWILTPVTVFGLYIYHLHSFGSAIDPGMAKIFLKELYALALLGFVLILLTGHLKKSPARALIIAWLFLFLVQTYQYNRRDAWTVHRPAIMDQPVMEKTPVRALILLSSPMPFDHLLAAGRDPNTPSISQLFESASRGRFEKMRPDDPASIWASFYTGSCSYRHRVFRSTIRRDLIFPELDLLPSFWPSLPGTKNEPIDAAAWPVPPLWETMLSFSYSCALYYPPFTGPPPKSASRAVTDRGSYPADLPPERSPAEFIQKNPASLLLVRVNAGDEGAGLDTAIHAALSVTSELDEIIVVEPIEGRWFLHWGAGVAAGETTAEARVVDFLPTVLYLFQLPIPRATDGRVLLENFTPTFRTSRTITVMTGGK